MHNIIDEKFWLAIAFLAFAIMVLRHVWPILSKKIDEQSKQIASDLLEAKEMKEQAKILLQESKKQYDLAIANSKKLLLDAEIEAKKFMEDSKLALESEVSKKMTALNNRIKGEEEKIIRDIKTKIVTSALQNIQSGAQNIEKERANNIVKNSLNDISKLVH